MQQIEKQLTNKPPKLDPVNWELFRIKFFAYLAAKDGADSALTQTKPRMPTKDELEQLDPEIRKKKLIQSKQKITKWTRNDKVAYHALLEASEGNATANIIILDCGYKASA